MIAIAYVPVLHQGYRKFFTSHQLEKIYVLGSWLIREFDHLRKDIRALNPKLAKQSLDAWGLAPVDTLCRTKLKRLAKDPTLKILAANEEVTRQVIGQYLPKAKVEWSPIFLRWDRDSAVVNKKITADKTLSNSKRDQKFLAQAFAVAKHSADWWRQVGAVLVDKNGQVIATAYNQHLPSNHTPYALGDARSLFKRGKFVEVGTALHAEGGLIAQAAKQGISLEKARLYLTDFPCPYCARIVANSGIKELYFASGYAMLDGEAILKQAGVKLIRMES